MAYREGAVGGDRHRVCDGGRCALYGLACFGQRRTCPPSRASSRSFRVADRVARSAKTNLPVWESFLRNANRCSCCKKASILLERPSLCLGTPKRVLEFAGGEHRVKPLKKCQGRITSFVGKRCCSDEVELGGPKAVISLHRHQNMRNMQHLLQGGIVRFRG